MSVTQYKSFTGSLAGQKGTMPGSVERRGQSARPSLCARVRERNAGDIKEKNNSQCHVGNKSQSPCPLSLRHSFTHSSVHSLLKQTLFVGVERHSNQHQLKY